MFQTLPSNGGAALPSPEEVRAPIGADHPRLSAEAGHSPFDPAGELSGSVIGTDLTILGDQITIISQKSLQIDGDIRGDVSGKKVVVGVEGSVEGTVSSEVVDIHGGIRGAIRARLVSLHPTAKVSGDIVHQTLMISEGAQFEGRVYRPENEAELTPNLDPNTFPSRIQHAGKAVSEPGGKSIAGATPANEKSK